MFQSSPYEIETNQWDKPIENHIRTASSTLAPTSHRTSPPRRLTKLQQRLLYESDSDSSLSSSPSSVSSSVLSDYSDFEFHHNTDNPNPRNPKRLSRSTVTTTATCVTSSFSGDSSSRDALESSIAIKRVLLGGSGSSSSPFRKSHRSGLSTKALPLRPFSDLDPDPSPRLSPPSYPPEQEQESSFSSSSHRDSTSSTSFSSSSCYSKSVGNSTSPFIHSSSSSSIPSSPYHLSTPIMNRSGFSSNSSSFPLPLPLPPPPPSSSHHNRFSIESEYIINNDQNQDKDNLFHHRQSNTSSFSSHSDTSLFSKLTSTPSTCISNMSLSPSRSSPKSTTLLSFDSPPSLPSSTTLTTTTTTTTTTIDLENDSKTLQSQATLLLSQIDSLSKQIDDSTNPSTIDSVYRETWNMLDQWYWSSFELQPHHPTLTPKC